VAIIVVDRHPQTAESGAKEVTGSQRVVWEGKREETIPEMANREKKKQKKNVARKSFFSVLSFRSFAEKSCRLEEGRNRQVVRNKGGNNQPERYVNCDARS
jgi:hypothetical protein